jgi:hypothetical protein
MPLIPMQQQTAAWAACGQTESIEVIEDPGITLAEKRPEAEWTDIRCSIIVLWPRPEQINRSLFSPTRLRRQQRAQDFVDRNYPHVAQRLEHLRKTEISSDETICVGMAFERAYTVLHELAQLAKDQDSELPRPYTFGTRDNGVQFEWCKGEREIHLEIIPHPGGLRYEYMMCPSADPSKWEAGELPLPLDSSPVIRTFLAWVKEGWL